MRGIVGVPTGATVTADRGCRTNAGWRSLILVVSVLLASPSASMAADAPQRPSSRGRFGVGFQHIFWYAWGVGASVDLSPTLTLEGFRSVIGDTSYAGRLRVRLTNGVDRRVFAYGMVGSRRLSQITGTRFSRDIGSDLPTYGSETGIGAGLGIGIEQDLRRWISGAPLFVNAEIGAEHVGGFDKIDGNYTTVSLGIGLQMRF
jgi:hypothetical protein